MASVLVVGLARPSGVSASFLAALATRTLVVAVAVMVGLRLFGKRELGQMTVYDLATVMALANAVQNAMTRGSGYLLGGIVSAGTLLVLAGLFGFVFARVPGLERRVVGSPTLLVFQGRLIRDHLSHEGVTQDEVMSAVREHGLDRIDDVLLATLEVDGTISVIPRTAPRRHYERALPPARAPRPPGGR